MIIRLGNFFKIQKTKLTELEGKETLSGKIILSQIIE